MYEPGRGSPTKGSAFVKGGCGCLLGFLAVGFLIVLVGGRMHIDLGGAVLLFLIGGGIGLLVLWIYNKGRQAPTQRPPWNGPDEPGAYH